MRAVLCHQYGPPEILSVEDIPSLIPDVGQVIISVKAAGVNFPDSLVIQNKYQIKPPLPFSPGGELAGVIKSVGSGVTRFMVGQSVIAFSGWGAFAEEIAINEDSLIPMPAEMSYEVAGTFLMTYGTAYHALKDRAQVAKGETVLIFGAAGGIGIAAIEIAKALGARVIAAASSSEKLAVCKAHGADECINYLTENLRERLKAITDGRGVDVVCDPVGGVYSEQAIRSMAWRGRFLVIGFADGEIPKISLNLPLLKGCSILGVFWGDFIRREPTNLETDLIELVSLYRAGKIKPLVSARYPLAGVCEALNAMMQRKVSGKIVIIP
ncbi:NADPH:quinone oxidoreductase family protein [Glaciimonas sp. PAMC28666]|uniref:NADPH:quinone oxidoreductase family protein n=1 Tax=Glaciimonas sp. PAMC28666 TaxID=2807626 RepID=UPI0019667FDD|nr:NADPH:quinone oxidoreductase family protein [Glaciimonas sp. PAMC28666]QRX83591.1 NADPH:quinone oxidoreductase family protein [Glaciimonas sp. PAMC28666]